MNETLCRILFVLGYVLVIPSLTVFWVMGGKQKEHIQNRSLLVMLIGVALIVLAAQPYR